MPGHDENASPFMSRFAKLSAYDDRSARLAGIGLMLLSIFMFSFGDAMGKFLVGTYSVGQLLFLRACAALLLLLPMIWRQRREFVRLERPWLQLVRVTLSTLEVAAFFMATVYLPLADVITYYLADPGQPRDVRAGGVHLGDGAVLRQPFAQARAGQRCRALSIFDDRLGGDFRLRRVRRRAVDCHHRRRRHHHRRRVLYLSA